MALARQALKQLGEAAQKADPSSELGQTLLECIRKIAKAAPGGQASAPGTVEPQAFRNIQAQARQQAPMEALMRSMPQAPMAAPPTAGE